MSRPLGIAVVGCGNVSVRYHLPAYARIPDRVRVVALADVSDERIAEARAACGDPDVATATDWRAVVTRPDVDIVDVAVPPRLHAEVAEAAAAAGKHVLCEKPITTVPAEAARMISQCGAAGVTLGVWHNWAFYPEVIAAESIVAAGEVGEVRLAIVDYLGVPDIPGAGEAGRTWRHDPATAGGGVLIDMLHCLYITERMIGRDAQRVSAWISGNAEHPQVEATALCRLETDGPVALVNVGWGRGPGGVFIEGTGGTLEMRWEDGGTGPFVPLALMEVRTVAGARRAVEVDRVGLPEIHVRAMRDLVVDFVDVVEGGREPRMTGGDGLHALEVTLAAYASAALGRTVEVPLSPDDPLFAEGVAAVPRLDGPTWSPVRRQRLFASQPPPETSDQDDPTREMTMDVGLYTDSLPDFTFEQALDIAADAGITAIEIAVGGQSSAPHLRVDELLASAEKRAAFAGAFASRGLHIAALNCSAWPLHPVDGAFHDAVITKTMRLAAELGVTTVVSMSGTAGDGPGATTFNWTFMPWPDDAVAHGRRAWDAAVAYWAEKSRLAESCGVERIAFELHPLHVVYNVPTLQAFRAAVGPRIGANMDPSHLMWMGMDAIVSTRALGDAVYHVHIKDTEVVADQVAIAGVLDNRPFSDPAHRAWNFRTIGQAHDRAWWSAFLDALAGVGYDGPLSIEQEDPYAGQEEGVREAAAYLVDLLAARNAAKEVGS